MIFRFTLLLLNTQNQMRAKSYYITILISLFYFSLCLFVFLTIILPNNSGSFKWLLLVVLASIGIKKFGERNDLIVYNKYKLIIAVILISVIASVLFYVVPGMHETPLTHLQKARMIVK